jgi:hypothetical protein
MKNFETLKLRVLQTTQITLCIASYLTYLKLEEYGLFFAALSGWLLAEFIQTLNISVDFNNEENS